jgi:hypothetical protein
MHNEDLHDLYSSLNIIRVMIKSRKIRCGMYGREERCIGGFIGTPVRKRPPERPSGG